MRTLPVFFLSISLLAGCGDSSEESPPSPGGSSAGKGGSGGQAAGSGGSGQAGAAGSAAGQGGAGTSGQGGAGGTAQGGSAGASGEAGMGGSGVAGSSGSSGQSGGSGEGGQGGAAGACGACDQPGQVCAGGLCLDDCRRPGAVPCAGETVCDVGSEHEGKCVAPGDGCVISNPPEPCGNTICGPGMTCGPSGQCVLQPPCTKQVCVNGTCWGEACSCTRPEATCSPAPLGAPGEANTLNDPSFLRQGKSGGEGAIDLDFDPDCNAWAVTFISGPDYLRKVDPAGKVSSVTGVTNLNMGEVAVLTGKEGVFGGGSGDVALTYICCATCGCQIGPGGNPQGAAILDENAGTLPMKIPSTDFTSGGGPFGTGSMDTGPYGLSWGLDRTLYLGNVKENGDFVALDLVAGTSAQLLLFPARVNATAPFDRDRMIVALEGGQVWLVPVLGIQGDPKVLTQLPTHATSILRDPWSGRVYAELANLDIVSFKSDGSDLVTFAKAPAKGRIALAPDNHLYHLSVYPTPPEVVRFPMPTGL